MSLWTTQSKCLGSTWTRTFYTETSMGPFGPTTYGLYGSKYTFVYFIHKCQKQKKTCLYVCNDELEDHLKYQGDSINSF